MKMKYVILGIVILGIIIVLTVIMRKGEWKMNEEVKIGSIKNFHYFYTKGYAMNADVFYDLECDKECIATIKKYGESQEDAIKKTVDSDFVKQVEEILEKYEVGQWNNFHKTDKNVLDGDSFSMSITFQDDTSISASGYMRYPNNYSSVKNELDDLFLGQS